MDGDPHPSEPTAHRLRWADVDGDKRKELITVPIVGKGARLPDSAGEPVRLMCHRIPKDPTRDRWPVAVIDQTLTVVHGVLVVEWDNDGREEILTASNEGLHLFEAEGEASTIRWRRECLATGHAGEPPNRGSSEIAAGSGRLDQRFLATIEPWHGNEVAVYTCSAGADKGKEWRRQVIDDSLRAGHALCCADLDGDGQDEIVAGFRGEGTSLYGYRRTENRPDHWERFVIDAGGIAAQGIVAVDMNGDGRVDLVATGGTTHNAKLYAHEASPQTRPAK
jgi:hypothetical protein